MSFSGVGKTPNRGENSRTRRQAADSLKGPLKDKGFEVSENPMAARKEIIKILCEHNGLLNRIAAECNELIGNPYVHMSARIAIQNHIASTLYWRAKTAANKLVSIPDRCKIQLFNEDEKAVLLRTLLKNKTPASFEMIKHWEATRVIAAYRARELTRQYIFFDALAAQYDRYQDEPICQEGAKKSRKLCNRFDLLSTQVFPIEIEKN